MSAIVTPTTKSPAKPRHLVAAVFAAVLIVVIALAIGAWTTGDRGRSTTPTRGSVSATEPSPQSVNALSPELQSVNVSPTPPSPQSVNALSVDRPDSAIADWARAEGLTGLSAASLHQSVNVSPTPPHADALADSSTAVECRLSGPC